MRETLHYLGLDTPLDTIDSNTGAVLFVYSILASSFLFCWSNNESQGSSMYQDPKVA